MADIALGRKVCVDAVLSLDQESLNEKLIGIKKVPGGGLQDSVFVNGVAFKKTVSQWFHHGIGGRKKKKKKGLTWAMFYKVLLCWV